MELGDYLRIFVRRRWLVLGSTALVLLAAVLVTVLTSKTYSSQARLFVGTSGTSSNAQLKYAASQYTLQRMTSYTELDASGSVLNPVIRELNLHESVRSLDAQVTITNPPGTVILDVSVTSSSPARAATITNAVANRLSSYIDKLERGSSSPAAALVVVTVTKKAQANSAAVSPRPVLNVGLGLLAGLIIGALLAIVREQFDRSVRTVDEGVRIAGLPVLGAVPHVRTRQRRKGAAGDGGMRLAADAVANSMSRVRSNLSIMFGSPPRTLTVLSASEGDGGTTVALALLLSSARSGLRTCLIEADLRQPRLGDLAADPTSRGLVDVLRRRADLDDTLHEFETDAFVLPAGELPTGVDVDALLESRAFDEVLDVLTARFDLVIVNVGPATDTDGLLVARRTEAALLVARPGATDRESLRATALRVDPSGSHTTGLLFNALPARELRYAQRYNASVVPLTEQARQPARASRFVYGGGAAFERPAFGSAAPLTSPADGRPATRRVVAGGRPRYERHRLRGSDSAPADVPSVNGHDGASSATADDGDGDRMGAEDRTS